MWLWAPMQRCEPVCTGVGQCTCSSMHMRGARVNVHAYIRECICAVCKHAYVWVHVHMEACVLKQGGRLKLKQVGPSPPSPALSLTLAVSCHSKHLLLLLSHLATCFCNSSYTVPRPLPCSELFPSLAMHSPLFTFPRGWSARHMGLQLHFCMSSPPAQEYQDPGVHASQPLLWELHLSRPVPCPIPLCISASLGTSERRGNAADSANAIIIKLPSRHLSDNEFLI